MNNSHIERRKQAKEEARQLANQFSTTRPNVVNTICSMMILKTLEEILEETTNTRIATEMLLSEYRFNQGR